MDTKILRQGTTTNIILDGRLDTLSADDFEKAVAPIIDGTMQDVVIDCSALSYISSSGLRSFLLLKKTADSKGGKLTLKNLTPEVKTVFDMTGFTTIFGL
jgi:anti-anti-sigma factor